MCYQDGFAEKYIGVLGKTGWVSSKQNVKVYNFKSYDTVISSLAIWNLNIKI